MSEDGHSRELISRRALEFVASQRGSENRSLVKTGGTDNILDAIGDGVIEVVLLDKLLSYVIQSANTPCDHYDREILERLNAFTGTLNGHFHAEQRGGILTVSEAGGNSAFAVSGFSSPIASFINPVFYLYFGRRTENFPNEIAYAMGFNARTTSHAADFLIDCLFLRDSLFLRANNRTKGDDRIIYDRLAKRL